jgi:tripartite-type tricarboxylate transporter receptor subunit TctC
MRLLTRSLLALAMLLALLPATQALQTFPSHTVRLVVPYPPGGSADTLARIMADGLSKVWGQSVVVDNKAGAGGAIGGDAVAKSPPDGYNLVLGVTGALTIAPNLRKLPYDPVRDLAPVSLVGSSPSMLAVHPSVPANSVAELIALAKAKPGTLTFSSAGPGTSVHIAGELFKSMAGIDILHVPYKGGGPSVAALLAGEVSMTFENVTSLAPYVQAGKLKGLAVTSAQRTSVAPDLPPVADTLKGYEVTTWMGLFAPAGTPPAIIEKVQHDLAQVLAPEDVRKRLNDQGIEIIVSSPDALAAHVKAELARFGKVIREASITE